jgi:hypothetical protein
MTVDDAARDALGFIAEHLKVRHMVKGYGDVFLLTSMRLQSILAGKKLIMRRLRFCNSKINSLQSELNEALQLNMSGITCDASELVAGWHAVTCLLVRRRRRASAQHGAVRLPNIICPSWLSLPHALVSLSVFLGITA